MIPDFCLSSAFLFVVKGFKAVFYLQFKDVAWDTPDSAEEGNNSLDSSYVVSKFYSSAD